MKSKYFRFSVYLFIAILLIFNTKPYSSEIVDHIYFTSAEYNEFNIYFTKAKSYEKYCSRAFSTNADIAQKMPHPRGYYAAALNNYTCFTFDENTFAFNKDLFIPQHYNNKITVWSDGLSYDCNFRNNDFILRAQDRFVYYKSPHKWYIDSNTDTEMTADTIANKLKDFLLKFDVISYNARVNICIVATDSETVCGEISADDKHGKFEYMPLYRTFSYICLG